MNPVETRARRTASVLGGIRSRLSPMTVLQVAAVVVLAVTWYRIAAHRWENDAYGYWIAWEGGLYDIPWLTHGAYTYSPAFAQAIYPWTLLSWRLAWALESGAQIAALALVCGPLLAVVLFYVPLNLAAGYPNPVAATIDNGNIEVLIALAIVASYRWPSAWALVLHTKIVPAIGILWYALRREWRNLALAIVPAVVIGAISFIAAPQLWAQWLDLLRTAGAAETASREAVVPLPLLARLPISVGLLIWGARTDRFWVVPIAATLALPAIRLGGLAVAVAAVPFLLARSRFSFLVPGAVLRLWAIERDAAARPKDPEGVGRRLAATTEAAR